MSIRVCHITTVHPAFDNRIFYRECISLAKAGYEVHLLIANQEEKAGLKEGVRLHNIHLSKARIPRFLFSKKSVLKAALEIEATIYHFHDPELLPVGKRLKQLGKKVIYDSHEDVPRQILHKSYIPRFIRPIISKFYERMENKTVRQLDAVVSPTPHIQNRFSKINSQSVAICNFPKKEFKKTNWDQRKNELCYIGSLTKVRGILEMTEALQMVDSRLNLAGHWWEEDYKKQVAQSPGWKKVNALGYLNKEEVEQVLSQSKIGLVTLHPIESYQVAYAVKMFEYMANGIPMVASNFPLWKSIVAENNCGICVDPLNPNAIAEAINYLLQNEDEAKTMGENGQKAFLEKYNWNSEKEKLIALYQSLNPNRPNNTNH